MQEFLDTEWYDTIKPFTVTSKKSWASSKWFNQTVELSLPKMRMFARASRVREVRLNDRDVLADLHRDITKNGIREPLLVKVDQRGKMTLFDGYHRFCISEDLDLDTVPVRFERCSSLALESQHIADIIHALLS